MDTYNRPITPPSDRTKDQAINNVTSIPTANSGVTTIPSYLERKDDLNDISHLQRQQEAIHHTQSLPQSNTHASSMLPVNTASSAPTTAAISSNTSTSNPFVSKEEKKLSDTPITNNNNTSSIPATRKLSELDDHSSPFNDIQTKKASVDQESSRKYDSNQRNDTTHRIESEVLSILQWKNPIRSSVIFVAIVGSMILTRWYSLLQISATCLTLTIGINLIYVNLILQSQKVLTNQDPSHPYNDVIHNEKNTMIDKRSVRHYSTVITEVAETVVRALTRIIFIENTITSIKWMSIFFVIWKISAHVSTMDIVLMVVISAFIFPRIYISNKDVVDAQIQKGQTLLQIGINKAQTATAEGIQDTYTKARAFVAQVGTTGTDAKNTMSKSSVTMKEHSL